MGDPEVVMAAGAVVSAVIALGALVLSIIGLVRSNSAAKDAQTAREDATSAQWKMSEHLETIAEAQAQAALATAHGGSVSGRAAGRLSARLASAGRGERLIVANVGTQALTIESIDVDEDVLTAGQIEEVLGAELEPGEDVSLVVGISFGTRLPLTVTLGWRDHDGQARERVQKVTLA